MEKKRINIMTSCDNKLAKYILPQLASIEKNLSAYDVHFFLAHNRVQPENLYMLQDFCASKTHITFHEALVTDNIPFYQRIAEDSGHQWPYEAYFTVRPQDYLPDEVDRILYIDAGDVIIDGDIAPYYFDDFEGNSLITTLLRLKKDPVTKTESLYTNSDLLTVAHSSFFNSGSYVINVEKFRANGYTIDDYIYLSSVLVENKLNGYDAYMGDQGFLAAAFVGDAKIFGYPANTNPSYMPYNFRSSYWGLYDDNLTYKPVIIHYEIKAKPWIVRFSDEAITKVIDDPHFIGKHLYAPIPNIALLTPQHLKLAEIWWQYAKETPIYDEAATRAAITAENWIEYYFPMCIKYMHTYVKHCM